MPQSITFDGAAQTVTGSLHILDFNGRKVLVDCGMFQGSKELRARNWEPFPFDPRELSAVVVTHAHIDHIGLLPKLCREGYAGPIYATRATIDLSRISLPDSGRLQEEDAYQHKKHKTRQEPILPLYTERDAYECLKQFHAVDYHALHPLPGGATWQFLPAGHILGSAFAEIYFENGERIVMSGDLGRYNTPIIKDPTTVENAEYLVVESTYGDRFHAQEDPMARLASVLQNAWRGGRPVLVPSFAIGRTQELLYYISKLQWENQVPRVPIYIDSPMATSVTSVYARCQDELDEEMLAAVAGNRDPFAPDGLRFVRDREASKALNASKGPLMIIAGSGMANGGRIVHHLLHRLSDPNTLVLFSGYQGIGTLGRKIQDGDPKVRILGQEVMVRAETQTLGSLSAHADQGEIMRWLSCFKNAPKKTFIVHGEPPAQAALKARIVADLGWNVEIPARGDRFDL
ncbi:MAG: MBL fold metallo-hydrolase RNA specificity domain-containing protein [Fimbriimonadaceae bacterium]